MGKAGRAKNDARDEVKARKVLPELLTAIGEMYGTEAECVEATALLCIVAGRLGIQVRPRAVSVFAHSPSTGATSVTGAQGLAEAQKRGLFPSEMSVDDFPEDRPWSEVGHMIAQSNIPLVVLDPTLRQFSLKGLPSITVMATVASASPGDGKWHFQVPGTDVEIIYFIDDGNPVEHGLLEAMAIQLQPDADALTDWFRSGGTAEGMRHRITPPTRMGRVA